MRATYGGAMAAAAIGLAFSVTLGQTACRSPAPTKSTATTEAVEPAYCRSGVC